jgi:chromate transporter
VNLLVLYLLLLKATATAFSGLSSIPVIHDDLVVRRHLLTDRQLNAAVVVGQSTPGPMGIYVVSVGYFVAGVPGAVVAWLAVVTPALGVIGLLRYVSRKADSPRVRGVLQAVVISSAGLLLGVTFPLARDAVTGVVPLLIALGCLAVLVLAPRVDTAWVILGSVCIALAASFARVL